MASKQAPTAVTEILHTTDRELFETEVFVLTALRIPHQTVIKDRVYFLLVPEQVKARARREIEEYLSELDKERQHLKSSEYVTSTLHPLALLFMSALVLFYGVTGPWDNTSSWFQLGAGDSRAILEHHQWYRLITSLTLHADIIHLLYNCFFGGVILHFFFLLMGYGLGPFAILTTAAAGNAINVLLHGPDHLFVGFSTAVFSAIGLLSMVRYSEGSKSIGTAAFLPLMSGVALLAMLGSSGEQTDLGAHFFGFLTGLALGTLLSVKPLRQLRDSTALQSVLFIVSLLAVGIAWISALHPSITF